MCTKRVINQTNIVQQVTVSVAKFVMQTLLQVNTFISNQRTPRTKKKTKEGLAKSVHPFSRFALSKTLYDEFCLLYIVHKRQNSILSLSTSEAWPSFFKQVSSFAWYTHYPVPISTYLPIQKKSIQYNISQGFPVLIVGYDVTHSYSFPQAFPTNRTENLIR